MSLMHTVVTITDSSIVPGSKVGIVMGIIFNPVIADLIARRQEL